MKEHVTTTDPDKETFKWKKAPGGRRDPATVITASLTFV